MHENTIEATILDARPTTLKYSGDNITLTWRNVNSPSKYDWLGIYMPSDSPINEYIGYILLSTCPTWTTGTCSLNIPLINMRSSYKFRIFKGVFVNLTTNLNVTKNNSKFGNLNDIISLDKEGNPLPSILKQLAVSAVIHFYNYNEPTQIHLALTSKEDAIRVMFITRDPIKSKVRFGTDEDGLEMVVDTKIATYSQTDMCDEPASSVGWRDPGYIHNAIMEGLSYGSRYYYQASKYGFKKSIKKSIWIVLLFFNSNMYY